MSCFSGEYSTFKYITIELSHITDKLVLNNLTLILTLFLLVLSSPLLRHQTGSLCNSELRPYFTQPFFLFHNRPWFHATEYNFPGSQLHYALCTKKANMVIFKAPNCISRQNVFWLDRWEGKTSCSLILKNVFFFEHVEGCHQCYFI